MLNTKIARQMHQEGRTEEVRSILLSDFYTFANNHPGSSLMHLALLTDYRWRMSNPGEENMDQVKEILEEYLKCPFSKI